MKTHLFGEEFFMRTDGLMDRQADRHTGITRLIVSLRSFANTPKKTNFCPLALFHRSYGFRDK